MAKWQRSFFQPVLPLGEDGRRVTGSKEHIALSRMAAGEGMVLLKNEKNTLPIRKGTKVALFGKGTVDYVKGGGGSGDVTVEYIRNLYEGMKIKEDEGKVEVFDKLAKYYEEAGIDLATTIPVRFFGSPPTQEGISLRSGSPWLTLLADSQERNALLTSI